MLKANSVRKSTCHRRVIKSSKTRPVKRLCLLYYCSSYKILQFLKYQYSPKTIAKVLVAFLSFFAEDFSRFFLLALLAL